MGVFFYGIIFQNIDEKLNGEGATSSMVRFGDTYVGAMMLSKNPGNWSKYGTDRIFEK